MARRKQLEPIKTRSAVLIDGVAVPMEELSPEKRAEVATKLVCALYNTVCKGVAVFRPATEEDKMILVPQTGKLYERQSDGSLLEI